MATMTRRPPAAMRTRVRRSKRTRAQVKQIIERALREEFPSDTVDVSDGYRGNIHVLVVSRRFDRMSEREKPQFLWRIIDQTELSRSEKTLVSLILPVSPAELK